MRVSRSNFSPKKVDCGAFSPKNWARNLKFRAPFALQEITLTRVECVELDHLHLSCNPALLSEILN